MRIAILGGTGAFGLALAARLVEAGDEVVIGSRDAERAWEKAREVGASGAANEDAISDADLVVLAPKADAALATAAALADVLGGTPLLSVASELRVTSVGALPGSDPRSLAERAQELVGGARARARREGGRGPRARRRSARERACARGDDGRDRQPQQALQGPRRRSRHGPSVTHIVEIRDPAERSRIAEVVLRDLPEWFGLEAETAAYIKAAAELPTFAVKPQDAFLCLKQHTPWAAEIYVMGVRREQHRGGLGRSLVAAAEAWCRDRGIRYLHVKTLGPSRPSRGYDATRAFYEAVGFVALEELHGLCDEDNPAVILVKDVRPGFSVMPIEGLPELRAGDDLAALIAERTGLQDGDVLVVAQKAVSKIEGRVVALADVEPSGRARELAGDVRVRPPLLIARTRQGYVCGSAGVDASNAPEPETVVLLPVDPDASAARLREELRERTGVDVGVVVTDSFGRPWRAATTDVAIGAAGVEVVRDLAGERDPTGYELHSTRIAVADEIAGAAQLVFGKLDRVPVAVIRGLDVRGDARAADLVIPPETDLFR